MLYSTSCCNMFDKRREFSQQPFPEQIDRVDPPSLGWLSLYRWQDTVVRGTAKEVALRYSRYKYGDSLEISRFSEELRVLIEGSSVGDGIKKNPEKWVVFTPPYSSVEPAVRVVGNTIAKAFNIPHVNFRTEPVGDRKIQYAAMTDFATRMQAKFLAQTAIDDAVAVEGKKALVMDDMVTTGVTATYMNKVLYEKYHLGYVAGFCLIDLVTNDPSTEEFINRFLIVSGDVESLITILSDQNTVLNRHTVKSLYGEDKYVLDAIVPRLLPSVIEKLEQARDKYYFGKGVV